MKRILDDLLGIPRLTQVDVKDLEMLFIIRHKVKKGVDSIPRAFVSLCEGAEAHDRSFLRQRLELIIQGNIVPGNTLADVIGRNSLLIYTHLYSSGWIRKLFH